MILEGAQAVFATSGYAAASTSKVAGAAGVSAPALYRYFRSKKDLYLSSLKAGGLHLLDVWRRIADEVGNPLEIIWTIGLGYYDHPRHRFPVTRLWFRALGDTVDHEVRDAIAANFVAAVDFFENNLEEGKRRGLVRRDLDSRVAAWHFMAIGFTFDLVHLLGRDEELDRAKVKDWGRLYLESVRAPGRVEGRPVRTPALRDERCRCGNLIAKLSSEVVEILCRRCKRVHRLRRPVSRKEQLPQGAPSK